MDNQENKPKYEMIERDGEQMRFYSDTGVLQRKNLAGQWVFATGTARKIYDSESGTEAITKRWNDFQEAKILGLQEATLTDQPTEAVTAWVREGAKKGLGSERNSAAYYSKVTDIVGLQQPKGVHDSQGDGIRLTVEGRLEDFRELFERNYRDDRE